jgi:hypothetical protein
MRYPALQIRRLSDPLWNTGAACGAIDNRAVPVGKNLCGGKEALDKSGHPQRPAIGGRIPPAAGDPESEEPAAGSSHEHPVRDPEPRVDRLLVARFLAPSAVSGRARTRMTLAKRSKANHSIKRRTASLKIAYMWPAFQRIPI